MEEINWKEKTEELLKSKNIDSGTKHHAYEYLYKSMSECMIDFAKLACEEQKKICASESVSSEQIYNAEIDLDEHPDEEWCNKLSILQAPTVKFE